MNRMPTDLGERSRPSVRPVQRAAAVSPAGPSSVALGKKSLICRRDAGSTLTSLLVTAGLFTCVAWRLTGAPLESGVNSPREFYNDGTAKLRESKLREA